MENDTHDIFFVRHKDLCEKSKVLLDPNLINCRSNVNHIDFDPALTSDETNVAERDLKLKFMRKVPIPELKLRMDESSIYNMNFETKLNKLKSLFQEEKCISHIILTIEQFASNRSAAMVLTEYVLLCMLHMNMRDLEKFVKLLLQEGLNYNVNEYT